jgi:hypothetical protein
MAPATSTCSQDTDDQGAYFFSLAGAHVSLSVASRNLRVWMPLVWFRLPTMSVIEFVIADGTKKVHRKESGGVGRLVRDMMVCTSRRFGGGKPDMRKIYGSA